MRRIVVTKFGGPEVLELQDAPIPEPKEGEAMVRVHAAGINYADIMQREGLYPGGPKPPFGAGFEIAGMVDAVGPGVTNVSEGDKVMGFCAGGYAEFAVAPAAGLMPIPDGLDFLEAAAIPCQYLTAYHALVTLSNISEGQTVLIQAAAGGLGLYMVQIAKLRGATVIGTCSSEAKINRLRSLGCDYPVNYTTHDFAEAVNEATVGEGCDAIMETVGGDVFKKSLAECLKSRGRLVVIGVASKDAQPVETVFLLANNYTVSGFHLNDYMTDGPAMTAALTDLHAWLGTGKLKIFADHVYPLAEASQAHQDISARKTSGKVLLRVD